MHKWSWWIFVPALNWLTWAFAASRTKEKKYRILALFYAAPLVIAMVASDFIAPEVSDVLGGIYGLSWLGGIAHWQIVKEEVYEKIALRQPPKAVLDPLTVPAQVIERVIIKEIVKIPCPYCSTLNENTQSGCLQCGAKLR